MRDSTADGWYVTMGGEKHGPFGRDVLKAIAKSGNLNPRTDRVWRAGMEDWVLAGEIEDLFDTQDPVKTQKDAAKAEQKATASTTVYAPEEQYQTNYEYKWPGIGRAGYFFAPPIMLALISGLIFAVVHYQEKLPAELVQWGPLAFACVAVLGLILISLQRFTNLGMSKWWLLGLLIPGLGVWVKYRLFACPPGYGPNRKQDGIGWFLAIIYWLGIVGTTVASLVIAVPLAKQFKEDMNKPEFREKMEQVRGVT